MPMVDEAMQQHETAFEEMKLNLIDSGLDEQSATEKAYSNIFSSSPKGTRRYLCGVPLVNKPTKQGSIS